MKITINPHITTLYEISAWPINIDGVIEEPERVSVDKGRFSYALVFDEKELRLEIWEINSNGELQNLKNTIRIPQPLSNAEIIGIYGHNDHNE